ncbi:MAG: ATP-dependent helicase [Lachnospiraceae bacterium]|nr:ATP-dependent helicase [Lachnospiraceae bacterium]
MIWNREQKAAVLHRDGPCLVLAGPGSGKTAVITARAAELVKGGVRPERILVLTFTRAAAEEMRERYSEAYPGDSFSGVTFSTFHALCFSVLKKEGLCGPDALVTAEEKRRAAAQAVREYAETDDPQERRRLLRKVLETDAKPVNDPGADEDPVIRCLTQRYRESLRSAGKIDFHDMVRGCLELFLRDRAALERVRARFAYVMVDEAQDMSREQLRAAELLAGPQANLFVVGDDDQSIYGFRGVSPRNMAEAAQRWKDTRVIRLSVNYRSVPAVTEAAGRLIRHNRDRFAKTVRPFRTVSGEEAVSFRIFRDEHEEAERIAGEILGMRDTDVPLSEIAVLCRTSGRLRLLFRTLAERGIPCIGTADPCRGLRGQVQKDLDAFAGLAEEMRRSGTWNGADLKHALYALPAGLYAAGAGEGKIDPRRWQESFRDDAGLFEEASRFIRDIRALMRMDRGAMPSYICHAMGYHGRLRGLCEKSGASVLQARQLLAEWADGRGEMPDHAETSAGVHLITMHAAKGLEFHTVFLPSLNEGVIPHSSAKSAEAIEEERRLMYVAVTRAKDSLRLSCVRTLHAHHPAPSRFLKEMLGTKAEL